MSSADYSSIETMIHDFGLHYLAFVLDGPDAQQKALDMWPHLNDSVRCHYAFRWSQICLDFSKSEVLRKWAAAQSIQLKE
ncbi:hypothetical protein VNI00_006444 [Paramarasmius palmivorus]|uniref:Uncharacterized protein n=1 Tax=Paramarasmius palmivorus TaxID=297713 RepID=A0AAW0D7Z8_9AGAR